MVYCKLNVHYWNANGISNKMPELREYLKQGEVDVMFVSEIKVSDTYRITARGYDIITKHRPNNRYGGIAVFVKKEIPFTKNPNVACTIENLGIQLQDGTALIGVYNRPANNFRPDCIHDLLTYTRKIILIGDFNAKHRQWNCNVPNTNGTTLTDYLDGHNNCTLHYPPEPTHYPENAMTPTTIDLMINKYVPNATTLFSHSQLSSDHNPIYFKLYTNAEKNPPRKVTSYKNADWNH